MVASVRFLRDHAFGKVLEVERSKYLKERLCKVFPDYSIT